MSRTSRGETETRPVSIRLTFDVEPLKVFGYFLAGEPGSFAQPAQFER